MRRMSLFAACVLSTLVPRVAHATYSIVATDTATSQVGASGTSCLGGGTVYIIYGSVPGKGVVAAQAAFNQNGRTAAVQQLNQGAAPASIIQAITAGSFDSNASSRQYGIVDLQGRAAGYTGSNNGNFADDRQGKSGTNYTYSTQGNILTGPAVLDQAANAFETQGCDLADKLMLALEAGGKGGQGDSRCTGSRGIPSDSAFIQVDLPTGKAGSFLLLRVDNSRTQNPLTMLRSQFNTWRASHPCGSTGGAGGTGGTAGTAGVGGGGSGTGGAGGTAGSGVGGVGGSAGSGTMGVGGSGGSGVGGSGVGGASGSGAASSGGSSGAAGGGAQPSLSTAEDDSGCGCRTTGGGGLPWTASAMLGLALLARRRRARRRR